MKILLIIMMFTILSPLSGIASTLVGNHSNTEVNTQKLDSQYKEYEPMSAEEMEDTKGKVGPLVIILAKGGIGAGVAIAGAYATSPNNSPSTSDIISSGTGGFVGGVLTPAMGATAASALGLSAMGASQAAFGGSGSGSCNSCHTVNHR
ncbi:hypothetical protein [Serratia inhibens]